MYLDDVSVYSLLASRLGAIATEFTATETATLQAELSGSGGTSFGLAKAETTSRVGTTQSQTSQVLRKSIIQTTFKELYEYERDKLALCPIDSSKTPPQVESVENLIAGLASGDLGAWATRSDELDRGALIEVDVELGADTMLRIHAVFNAVIDMFSGNTALLPPGSNEELDQARAVNLTLEKLLAGLVPIRGLATDYLSVSGSGRSWIVDARLASRFLGSDTRVLPLWVVGVTEQALFWKDVRRVLFSKSRYRMLCRVSQPGVQEAWNPIKLVDVLREVNVDLANQVNSAGRHALAAMGAGATDPSAEDVKSAQMRAALVAYGLVLADLRGKSLSEDELSEVGLLDDTQCSGYGTPQSRREAFAKVAEFVADKFKGKRDPVAEAKLRGLAMLEAGLLGPEGPPPVSVPSPAADVEPERLIDSEIVAIYW